MAFQNTGNIFSVAITIIKINVFTFMQLYYELVNKGV